MVECGFKMGTGKRPFKNRAMCSCNATSQVPKAGHSTSEHRRLYCKQDERSSPSYCHTVSDTRHPPVEKSTTPLKRG